MVLASPMVLGNIDVAILLAPPLNLFDSHEAGVTWRLLNEIK